MKASSISAYVISSVFQFFLRPVLRQISRVVPAGHRQMPPENLSRPRGFGLIKTQTVLVFGVIALTTSAFGQTEDFNSGTDPAWKRANSLARLAQSRPQGSEYIAYNQ